METVEGKVAKYRLVHFSMEIWMLIIT